LIHRIPPTWESRLYESAWGERFDGIVAITVEVVAVKVHGGHLLVGDLDGDLVCVPSSRREYTFKAVLVVVAAIRPMIV
jgi:hypothetical protein